MEFKYNEIKALKERYDEVATQIRKKSDFVYHNILAGVGYVCDGFDFKIEDDGTLMVLQNAWDGYDGESAPNSHIAYPFRWLNMTQEEIIKDYQTTKTDKHLPAYHGAGTCF